MRRHTAALTLLLVAACAVERPGVSNEKYTRPKFTHGAVVDGCVKCHEVNRPAPDDEGNEHGGGGDCGTCHNPSDEKAGWLPPKFFAHDPPPESCLACHEQDRPEPPHAEDGDCAGCHQYPAWK
jgi:hypothetical protein